MKLRALRRGTVHESPLGTSTLSPPPPIVLLVEDDRDTVGMYESHLNGVGYRVAAAYNGADACRAFDELKPDIVVTDLGLPGRSDGIHVIEHVPDRSGGRVPVILVTGHERATVPHAAAARVVNILVKPVLPDPLESVIRDTLTRARRARERTQAAHQKVSGLVARSTELSARSQNIMSRVRAATGSACPAVRW